MPQIGFRPVLSGIAVILTRADSPRDEGVQHRIMIRGDLN